MMETVRATYNKSEFAFAEAEILARTGRWVAAWSEIPWSLGDYVPILGPENEQNEPFTEAQKDALKRMFAAEFARLAG